MSHELFRTVVLSVFGGVFCYAVSRRYRIPPVPFYLGAGLALGPLGANLIQPTSLHGGLLVVVESVVAVILFEGGLSLSVKNFRRSGKAIRRIFIVALPLTGAAAAVLVHTLLLVPLKASLFFGSLLVVTGPTVMGTLLKSVRLTPTLHHVLHWESIWGDVVGVGLSALALEWMLPPGGAFAGRLGLLLGLRIAVGLIVGIVSGRILGRFVLRWVESFRDVTIPPVLTLVWALGTFALANEIVDASGPLAAAVAGFVLAHEPTESFDEIRRFKEQLSVLLVGTLFVLLAALVDFRVASGRWPQILGTALILGALVRPGSTLLALVSTPMPWRERFYAGFIGPRGIVMLATVTYASLVVKGSVATMNVLLELAFVIVFLSGLFSTVACRPLADLLHVSVSEFRSGILMVGIHRFSSDLATFLKGHVPVAFIDTNPDSCSLASSLGHETVCADVLDGNVYEDAREQGFGRFLALSRNDALNQLVTKASCHHLDPEHVYRARSSPQKESILVGGMLEGVPAFKEHFDVGRAVKDMEAGRAELKVLSPVEAQSEGVVPLLELLAEGRGVRIVTAGTDVRQKSLCLVQKLSSISEDRVETLGEEGVPTG